MYLIIHGGDLLWHEHSNLIIEMSVNLTQSDQNVFSLHDGSVWIEAVHRIEFLYLPHNSLSFSKFCRVSVLGKYWNDISYYSKFILILSLSEICAHVVIKDFLWKISSDSFILTVSLYFNWKSGGNQHFPTKRNKL